MYGSWEAALRAMGRANRTANQTDTKREAAALRAGVWRCKALPVGPAGTRCCWLPLLVRMRCGGAAAFQMLALLLKTPGRCRW